MMPVMDGYEACRKIREMDKYRNIPIIALTAKAMKEDYQLCLDAGASDYLSKPIDGNLLLSIIRAWLY
jgi:CheY-like chemotaxis protein